MWLNSKSPLGYIPSIKKAKKPVVQSHVCRNTRAQCRVTQAMVAPGLLPADRKPPGICLWLACTYTLAFVRIGVLCMWILY